MPKATFIEVPAMQISQGKHVLYSFAVDGKKLESFTTVSSIGRDADMSVKGYQRPEVRQHIAEITAYLDTPGAMLPNALVIAFDQRIKFKPLQVQGIATFGVLTIPTFSWDDQDKRCGFVVDGQQRRAAIRDAKKGIPVFCTGFQTVSEQFKREQFILVNNAKPLSKSLIYELLPGTETMLPVRLDKQKLPVVLCDRMNLDKDSPLCRLIQIPTMPCGLIKDNSFLKLVRHSVSDGVLYQYRGGRGCKDADVEGMLRTLKDFWMAVSQVFPDEWAKPPRFSRLFHGTGVVGLGFIMDSIASNRYRSPEAPKVPTYAEYVAGLMMLKPHCFWSNGTWEFGKKWDDLQNTPNDVSAFSNWIDRKFNALMREKNEVEPRRDVPANHPPRPDVLASV